MSTEHPYNEGSEQRAFLEVGGGAYLRRMIGFGPFEAFFVFGMQAELAKADANRENVPWVILVGHRPMYCSDESEKGQHWPGASFQQIVMTGYFRNCMMD